MDNKEFAVIQQISNNKKPTQRDIAKKVGISLGLTNLIIKRLIKKGYIKIKEVPPRTIQYMLTPKGFSEKVHKSYEFTLITVNSIKTIKENIQDIIKEKHKLGVNNFTIFGDGELATLTEIAFRDLELKDICVDSKKNRLSRCPKTLWDDNSSSSKLTCKLMISINGKKEKIDILKELSRRGIYY